MSVDIVEEVKANNIRLIYFMRITQYITNVPDFK